MLEEVPDGFELHCLVDNILFVQVKATDHLLGFDEGSNGKGKLQNFLHGFGTTWGDKSDPCKFDNL